MATARPRGILTEQHLNDFHEQGFTIVRGAVSPEEIQPLTQSVLDDPTLEGRAYGWKDPNGKPQPLVGFADPGRDLTGVLVRLERFVRAAEYILDEEVYHYRSTFLIKFAKSPSRVAWHQDYAYWYDEGCLFPGIINCTVSLTRATEAHGALRFVPGSHKWGRIDHNDSQGSWGADKDRVEQTVKRLGLVICETEPGDAILWHGNALHSSLPNQTDENRVYLITMYNGVSNSPMESLSTVVPDINVMANTTADIAYHPLEVAPDDSLRRGKYETLFARSRFILPEEFELGPDVERMPIS